MRVRSLLTLALVLFAPLAVFAPSFAAADHARPGRAHAVARWANDASQGGQKPAPPPAPAPGLGQPAPDFSLHYLARTPDGKYEQKTVSLGQFKGQKSVILAFFPAAFSPG